MREPYETPDVTNVPVNLGRTPGIYFNLAFNIGDKFKGALCNLITKVKYVFRQRRMLEPIDPNRDSILFIERNQDGNLEEFNIDRKRMLEEF